MHAWTVYYTLDRLSTNEDNSSIPVLMFCTAILYRLLTRSTYSIQQYSGTRVFAGKQTILKSHQNHASIIPISQRLHFAASIQTIKSKLINNLFHHLLL